MLSGSSTFAAAVNAVPSLATAVKQSTFRGTLLVPTDQVRANVWTHWQVHADRCTFLD